MTSDALRLTHDLMAHRDGCMRLLGERYGTAVQPYREILRRVTEERKANLADVALEMCKKLESEGHDPGLMMAAFVDEAGS